MILLNTSTMQDLSLIITRETTKLRQQLGQSHWIMGKECSPPRLSSDRISTGDSSQTFSHSPDVTVQKPTLRLKEILCYCSSQSLQALLQATDYNDRLQFYCGLKSKRPTRDEAGTHYHFLHGSVMCNAWLARAEISKAICKIARES